MSGLLAFLIVLMIILLVAVVVMMISIINLTRHIRRSQENVEAVQRRVAKIDINSVSYICDIIVFQGFKKNFFSPI